MWYSYYYGLIILSYTVTTDKKYITVIENGY